MAAPTVFEGLSVVDFTAGFPGAIVTMVLADNGAQVTRVEPTAASGREADPASHLPGYRQWHRGKTRVELNLKDKGDLLRARDMAERADVVVEAFRPGTMDRLGLGYDTLKAANRRLVYCAISGFGRKGKYRSYKAYDGIVQARVGRMADFGVVFGWGRPVYSAIPVASFGASQMALQGILAALFIREKTGLGQRVDTSMAQGMTPYDMVWWFNHQMKRIKPEMGRHHATTATTPTVQYIPARTKDGEWLQFANHAAHLFWTQVQAIGLGHLKEDPLFAPLPHQGTEQAKMKFWEMVLQRVQEKTYAEWLQVCKNAGDVGVDLYTGTEAGMDHPQARHNGHVVKVSDPKHGAMEQVGPLVWMSETPSRIPGSNGAAAAISTKAPTRPAAPGETDPTKVMPRVTALELAVQYAAPFAPTLLADMGMRVIKIEPLTGDTVRAIPALAAKTLLGRESIAIDLKRKEGQEIVHRLAKMADILMHNYRPDVPSRLGIDYETLRKVNPRLVYLYAGAYGSSGPYSAMPAYHPISGAVCGNAIHQAGAGYPPPRDAALSLPELRDISMRMFRANEGNPDANSCVVVATAMLMGLLARERHGMGQEMLTTMLCSNAYCMSDDWIRYPGKPARKRVDSDLYGLGALYRLYQAKEGWVFLACVTDREWRDLCAAMGEPGLAKEKRFAEAKSREANDASLAERLSTVFRTRTADDWESSLTAKNIGCVRADNGGVGAFFDSDPHAKENGFTCETVNPEHGPMWRHANNVSLSLVPPVLRRAVKIGEHTRPIMKELGYSGQEVESLKAGGVITYPEP